MLLGIQAVNHKKTSLVRHLNFDHATHAKKLRLKSACSWWDSDPDWKDSYNLSAEPFCSNYWPKQILTFSKRLVKASVKRNYRSIGLVFFNLKLLPFPCQIAGTWRQSWMQYTTITFMEIHKNLAKSLVVHMSQIISFIH